jgi:hypothetical protein
VKKLIVLFFVPYLKDLERIIPGGAREINLEVIRKNGMEYFIK